MLTEIMKVALYKDRQCEGLSLLCSSFLQSQPDKVCPHYCSFLWNHTQELSSHLNKTDTLFILCTHLCLWHFDNSYLCCHPQGEYHLLWFIFAARKLQSLLFKQLFPHTNSFFAFSSSNIYGRSRIFPFFRRGMLPLRNEISDKWNRQFLYRILIILEGCNSSRGEEGMCTICYPSPDLPLCPKITHIFN